jgi:hypothetical protein
MNPAPIIAIHGPKPSSKSFSSLAKNLIGYPPIVQAWESNQARNQRANRSAPSRATPPFLGVLPPLRDSSWQPARPGPQRAHLHRMPRSRIARLYNARVICSMFVPRQLTAIGEGERLASIREGLRGRQFTSVSLLGRTISCVAEVI